MTVLDRRERKLTDWRREKAKGMWMVRDQMRVSLNSCHGVQIVWVRVKWGLAEKLKLKLWNYMYLRIYSRKMSNSLKFHVYHGTIPVWCNMIGKLGMIGGST